MKELSEVSGPLASEAEQRTGAYQSRIFIFFNRQANRLRDSVAQGFRQVRVSVQLTGQILLSPLRLFSRWKIRSGSQLPGTNSATLPPAVSQDGQQSAVAIERILVEISAAGYGQLASAAPSAPTYEDWSAIDEEEWDTALLNKKQLALAGPTATTPTSMQPVIQGLASRLLDRSLVLVDRNNKLLDVLSPSQQLHIRQRIDPQLTTLSETFPGSGSMLFQSSSAQDAVTVLPPRVNPRALDFAGDFKLLGSARSENDDPTDFSTPTIFTSSWRQLSHWFNFYREYFRVELAEPYAEIESEDLAIRSSAQASTNGPKMLQSAAATLVPQKGSAIVPQQAEVVTLTARGDLASQLDRKSFGDKVFKPEWIETPTRPLGYERSWLVRFLEWLDGLALAIENWLLGLSRRLFGE
jgi:hypothetical protein